MFSATATVGTGLPGRFGVDYAFINEVGNSSRSVGRIAHCLGYRVQSRFTRTKRKSTSSGLLS